MHPESFFTQIRSFTHEYLEITRKESLAYWNKPEAAEIKADNSPVTALDKRLEEIFRERSAKAFPTFGVIGEEYGVTNGDAEYRWVIDPIDGTMNLVNRIPTFGTIVSLLKDKKPIYGAIDHPLLGMRHDGGALCGVFDDAGNELSNFPPSNHTFETAIIAASSPHEFRRSDQLSKLVALTQKAPHLRIYYDCFSLSLAVRGSVQAAVACGLKIWDIAAVVAMIEGRGGAVRSLGTSEQLWSGKPTDRIFAVVGEKRMVDLVSTFLHTDG